MVVKGTNVKRPGSKVKSLLEGNGSSPKKERKMLYLDTVNFKKFENPCKEKGTNASVMVDAMIDDLLNDHKN